MLSRLKPSKTVAVAVVALIIGLEAPAAAQQISHKVNGKTIKANTVTGKQVKESTLKTVPKAKTAKTAIAADTAVTALGLPALQWHAVTLTHSWVNLDPGAGFGAAAYAVDAQGLVHLRGVIGGGTSGTVAFTLPSEATPTVDIDEPIEGNLNVGVLVINSDGTVQPYNQPGTTTADINGAAFLDAVTFSRY